MKILALEFSSDARSVAVIEAVEEGPPLREASPRGSVLSAVSETGAGATTAFELIERALADARATRKEIGRIAIGLGPGSYMGIRVAIALGQGWQLAQGTKLVGLNSADTMAAQAHEEGLRGLLHTVVDAQKNEVYLASYQLDSEGWRAVAPLRLAPIAELNGLAARGDQLVGPEVTRWCAGGRLLFPQARQLGLMAAARHSPVQGESLEPIYLRPVSFVKAAPALPGLSRTAPG